MSKVALVIGATGLVGSSLVGKLLLDGNYSRVKAFTRKPLKINHEKIENIIIDFDRLDQYKDRIVGDELFSCLGTTLKSAGSVQAFYKVDYTYQFEFIKIAKERKVKKLILISSPLANQNFFFSPYLRTKGKLEHDLRALNLSCVTILRPSILEGARNEKRVVEQLSANFLKTMAWIPFVKKLKPIPGHVVASAMVKLASEDIDQALKIVSLDDIFTYAVE